MNVRRITDLACNMAQCEAREQDVIFLPMKTVIDGEEYLDGVTTTPEEVDEKLENCKEFPATSQISPAGQGWCRFLSCSTKRES